MMATGPWQDTVYSACCFMGARRLSACATTLMRLHSGLLSIATTPTQPTSGSLTFRMVSVCSPPRRRRNTPPRWLLELQSPLPGGPPAWGWRSSTSPVSPLWKPRAGGNIGCRLIPGPSGSGQWHLQLSPLGCAQLTRKRGQGHLIGHARWTSSWKTRPCHLGSSMWDEATTAIASQSPNGALRLFPPQLRPVLLASALCRAYHAAPGGGPSGADRMYFGLRLRDAHGL